MQCQEAEAELRARRCHQLTHIGEADALGARRQASLAREGKVALLVVEPDLVREVLPRFVVLAGEEEVGEAIAIEVDEGVEVGRGELAVEALEREGRVGTVAWVCESG